MNGADYRFTDRDIESGLSEGQFEFWVQPQFALDSGEMVGGEAMVRWRHPTLGLLQPGMFLDTIARYRRTGDLTRAGLDQCARAIGRMRHAGQSWRICLNIARTDLCDPDFALRARATVERAGADPDDIVLEIAEADALRSGEAAYDGMLRLREMDFRLALDAKGPGLASRSLLDSGLIGGFKLGGPTLLRMAAASVKVGGGVAGRRVRQARRRNLVCVAVGVENLAMGPPLAKLGFQRVQGMAYARPAPMEEVFGRERGAEPPVAPTPHRAEPWSLGVSSVGSPGATHADARRVFGRADQPPAARPLIASREAGRSAL